MRGVEKDAKAYAGDDLELEENYLDSISAQPVYPVFGFTYKECKEKELNLGS